VAHEQAAGESVDAAAERVDRIFRPLDPYACQRIRLALGDSPAAVVLRHNGDRVVKGVPAGTHMVPAGGLDRARHESEVAHDSPDQAAPAPAVREDG
jgi:hypothetical protein